MKKRTAKHFFLLSTPVVLLLGFGFVFTRPNKPTLRIQSIRIKPIVTADEVIGNPKGVIAVEVFIENHNPSLISRLEEHGLFVDPQHGIFIQDEQGNKYGFSSTAPDRLKWHLTMTRLEGIDGTPFNLRFLLQVGAIPKSAGKLTLKTIFNLDIRDGSKAPARLPLSIVVRQN